MSDSSVHRRCLENCILAVTQIPADHYANRVQRIAGCGAVNSITDRRIGKSLLQTIQAIVPCGARADSIAASDMISTKPEWPQGSRLHVGYRHYNQEEAMHSISTRFSQSESLKGLYIYSSSLNIMAPRKPARVLIPATLPLPS